MRFSPLFVFSRSGEGESGVSIPFRLGFRAMCLSSSCGTVLFTNGNRVFKHIHCFIRVSTAVGIRRNGVELTPKGVWSKEEDEDLFTFK